MVERVVIGFAVLLSLGSPALRAQSASAAEPKQESVRPEVDDARFDTGEEQRMLAWVNDERAKAGLPALKLNRLLTLSARKHLLRMIRTNDLAHEFPDELPLMQRVAEQGMHFSATAENLAMATYPADMHSGLMNSPGHRANILGADYDSFGVAVIKNGNEFWSTQHFVRSTPELSVADAEAAFIQYAQQERKKSRMTRIRIETNKQIREAVCKMAQADRLKVHDLPSEDRMDRWTEGIIRSQRGEYAFTSLDLNDWPEKLHSVIASSNLERMYIGACFATSPKLPGGAYWFGVLF